MYKLDVVNWDLVCPNYNCNNEDFESEPISSENHLANISAPITEEDESSDGDQSNKTNLFLSEIAQNVDTKQKRVKKSTFGMKSDVVRTNEGSIKNLHDFSSKYKASIKQMIEDSFDNNEGYKFLSSEMSQDRKFSGSNPDFAESITDSNQTPRFVANFRASVTQKYINNLDDDKELIPISKEIKSMESQSSTDFEAKIKASMHEMFGTAPSEPGFTTFKEIPHVQMNRLSASFPDTVTTNDLHSDAIEFEKQLKASLQELYGKNLDQLNFMNFDLEQKKSSGSSGKLNTSQKSSLLNKALSTSKEKIERNSESTKNISQLKLPLVPENRKSLDKSSILNGSFTSLEVQQKVSFETNKTLVENKTLDVSPSQRGSEKSSSMLGGNLKYSKEQYNLTVSPIQKVDVEPLNKSYVSLSTTNTLKPSQKNGHAQNSTSWQQISSEDAYRPSTRGTIKSHKMLSRSTGISSQLYKKMSELAEANIAVGKQSQTRNYEAPSNKFQSRYSKQYNEKMETDDARSNKITVGARDEINQMQSIMKEIFQQLLIAQENLLKKDFSTCIVIVRLISELQTVFVSMIKQLRYSPYLSEMVELSNCLAKLISELERQPQMVLLRLVEFGYYMHEIGKHIRENLLPNTFALFIHSIQSRLFRMSSGRVIRQIYFVPNSFDPVLGTYFKSRRIVRIEAFCKCKIVLLPPEDPRCAYCPIGYRSIEVNFHPQKGCYLGFVNLLNQCVTSKIYCARLAATIFKRSSGVDVEMQPAEFNAMQQTHPRIPFQSLRTDLVNGLGAALKPNINIYS